MEKTVLIDGKPVKLLATAGLPRHFRAMFGVDFFSELRRLTKKSKDKKSKDKKSKDEESQEAETADSGAMLELVENLAFLMARSADPEHIPPDIIAWLDSISDPNAIFAISGDVIDLYLANAKTTVAPKKKKRRRNGK